jgi:hypothetical protein
MTKTILRTFRVLAGVALVALPAAAQAAPCAGFSDVDTSFTACPSIEWIKNRSITLGCGVGTYCPSAAVPRQEMAAFMNRLGDAMTPLLVRVDVSPGAIDLDATNAVVCQTQNFVVANFPRRAVLDLTFAAQAPADVDIAADLVKTTDNGATWTVLTAVDHRGGVMANRWSSVANLATTDLAVNETVRFGVRVSRASPGADLSDSRCNLRVAIGSRTGAASPF